jgi:hypothetical protein
MIVFQIRPSDLAWLDGPGVACTAPCSRCRKPIRDDVVPVIAMPAHARYVYRFHPECLGLEYASDESL